MRASVSLPHSTASGPRGAAHSGGGACDVGNGGVGLAAEVGEGVTLERIVMVARLSDVAEAARPWPAAVPFDADRDGEWTIAMSWQVYPHRPPFESLESIRALSEAAVRGDWGEVCLEASPTALGDDGETIANVFVVRRFQREGVPDCPYVLNCMVAPAHWGRGIAAGLLVVSARALLRDGETQIALTVDTDNARAVDLYRRLGFVEVARSGGPEVGG